MTTPVTAQAPVVFEGRGPRISLGYNPTVDYIRFLAALVIVQFHARAPLNVIGQGAVGFFILAMIWFTLNGLQRRKEPVGAAIAMRGRRLLYPFLIWGVLQILAKVAQSVMTGGSLIEELQAWHPPVGSFGQLWFLPWALAVSAVLILLAQKTTFQISSWRPLLFWLVLFALATIACLEVWSWQELPLILRLSVLYLPSVGVGMLLFAVRNSGWILIFVTAIICLFGLVLRAAGMDGTQQLILAPPIMVLSLMVRTPEFGWTRKLGQLSMDIYLVHILMLSVAGAILGIATHTFAGGIMICLLSLGAALVMQLPQIGKWLR
ncbi:hypothetical protein CN97_14085 [Haematobacter massiliensis]|uniref:Acyltransferase 3 domain-containing protein n=3 Tax=Haematobacter TaxID=366614 RepID=A0A086XRR7_9RHOB|nr:acyltransferase family protein [Haematobacter massiliensis]KFI24717.1 hypothetical protein CN97_14085 [Haematobacter massiliensis]